jgi:hypothetical protein
LCCILSNRYAFHFIERDFITYSNRTDSLYVVICDQSGAWSHAQKDLTIMYAVNAGRRPVTITGVGAYRLSPHDPFVERLFDVS